jgi:hypothetical protein
MTRAAADLVAGIRAELSRDAASNPVIDAFATGQAPLATIGALAAEETRIVASDRRSFLVLAARAEDPSTMEFFTSLASGEGSALAMLPALAGAAGLDEAAVAAYQPRSGCQAYPAYVAWLAVNAQPAEAIVAILANFSAWGQYCAALARSLRERYGLDDAACAFFDFFAAPQEQPSPLEDMALAAVQTRLNLGDHLASARTYARLLQEYETLFWRTVGATANA